MFQAQALMNRSHYMLFLFLSLLVKTIKDSYIVRINHNVNKF